MQLHLSTATTSEGVVERDLGVGDVPGVLTGSAAARRLGSVAGTQPEWSGALSSEYQGGSGMDVGRYAGGVLTRTLLAKETA
jgi:hypothetical protein